MPPTALPPGRKEADTAAYTPPILQRRGKASTSRSRLSRWIPTLYLICIPAGYFVAAEPPARGNTKSSQIKAAMATTLIPTITSCTSGDA